MVDEPTHRVLWVWTASELFLVLGSLALLTASLVGMTTVFSSVSRPVRMGAVAFLLVELSIPLWVYVDIRRREHAPDAFWIHVAAMLGLNLLGFVAYLQERRQRGVVIRPSSSRETEHRTNNVPGPTVVTALLPFARETPGRASHPLHRTISSGESGE